jgi:predicted metal-dependent phosphoesterase TrpH
VTAADAPAAGRDGIRVRVDMHVHSSASHDCVVAPELVARRCRSLGLGPVVLTDHGTVDGARRLAQLGRACVMGEEILTADGDLIGLFLDEAIPQGLSAGETVDRIRAQGGLVYLGHPYDVWRRRLSDQALERVADRVDIVEVHNGRADARANERAQDLCEILDVPAGAGSDAHTLPEIGSVYVEMEAFDGAADFLEKLRDARVVVHESRLVMRVRRVLRQTVLVG